MLEQTASLEQKVLSATTTPGKIDALNTLAWELRDVEPQRACQVAEEALQLAQSGEFSPTSYLVGIAHSHTVLSCLEFRKGDLAHSLSQASEAIAELERVEQSAWLPKLYSIVAANHYALGNHAECVNYLLKQLTLSQALGDEDMESAAYHDLALEYQRIGEYQQALDYLSLAQKRFARQADGVGEFFVLLNQALIHWDMKELDIARAGALAALQFARSLQYQHGELLALHSLGDMCRDTQQWTEAFQAYQQALTMVQQGDPVNLLDSVQRSLSELFLLQGDYATAAEFAQAALLSAEKLAADPSRLATHRLLAKIYKEQGDYPAAVTHLERAQQLAEVLFNLENERRLQAMIVLHQTEAARRETELLREKNAALEHEIAERQRAEQALIQAQKMESLGIMAGGVAHDFNNLLTGMIGQNSLALAKLSPDHAARPHLEKTRQSIQRAADLAHQMLAYSGKSYFTITSCDLNQEIQANWTLLTSLVQYALTIQLDLTPDPLLIKADRSQLYQILVNLVLNAREAGATTVTIRTQRQHLPLNHSYDWQYTGQPLASGDYVTLTVLDNGQGMTTKTRQRLFDPFYTTKFVGRGLGLAAVLGIVRGHGGGITVDSQPMQGATFTLLFPALPVPVTAIADAPNPSRVAGAALIIDDDASLCEMIGEILAENQWQVFTATDGASGLEQFRQYQQQIKVVLLDILMPGRNGWETLRQLRAHHAQLPVILTSGYPRANTAEHWQQDAFTHFLPKPFAIDRLLATVQQYLG